ncbi:MAG: hypothetical protein ACJA0V_000201 [Planctomycetota bacterium]|jgi:hypothetical protein
MWFGANRGSKRGSVSNLDLGASRQFLPIIFYAKCAMQARGGFVYYLPFDLFFR